MLYLYLNWALIAISLLSFFVAFPQGQRWSASENFYKQWIYYYSLISVVLTVLYVLYMLCQYGAIGVEWKDEIFMTIFTLVLYSLPYFYLFIFSFAAAISYGIASARVPTK